MRLEKPVFFVLGPSWYGDWAKDFNEALNNIGIETALIYTNTLGGIDLGGNSKTVAGLINGLKNTLSRVAPKVLDLIKAILRFRAEQRLIQQVKNFIRNKREVVVLFTWTPPPPEILVKLKRTGARLVLWQGEAPIRDERWSRSFGYFEHIFVYDRGWEQFLQKDIRDRVSVLLAASNPKRYYPVDKNPEFSCDVAFVGLYRKERAETLEVLRNYNLRIYGYNWEDGYPTFPWLKDKCFGPATADEVNNVFNNAKIVIGSFGMGIPGVIGETITQRTFDIPLTGNFQIGFYCEAANSVFDNSIIMFHDKEELERLVSYYLEHGDERAMLAKKAHDIAVREHTYLNRAKEMLAVLGY
jgi:spore maturation protein CgeB